MDKYKSKIWAKLSVWTIGGLFFGFWILSLVNYSPWAVGIFAALVVLGASYTTAEEVIKEQELELANKVIEYSKKIEEVEQEKQVAEINENVMKKSLLEHSKGFPTLTELISEYYEIQDDYLSGGLKTKSHPAYKAAETVKAEALRRRQAETNYKQIKAVIDYYHTVAPFLEEIAEDLPTLEPDQSFEDYTEEEAQDMVTRFVSKDEYRKLSVSDRNQMALDRYWSRRKKSNWLIGKSYERFVGYLYEQKGYHVEYFGIKERFEDLGRDLIAKKGDEILIVQCKHWSKFRSIHENHIFQLFGTTFEYNSRNKVKAKAVFFTSTKLTEIATEMCKQLGIIVKQDFPFKVYPSIKCNISKRTGERIYHLPFDQQYDNTRVDQEDLEKYAMTVKEAEKLGFRRAYRWHGKKAS